MTATADDRRWAAAASLGLSTAPIRDLASRLNGDLVADAWGFEQFADIDDVVQRAVCSDQVYGAANAIGTNLIEAALHLRDFRELLGNGVAQPRTEADMLVHATFDLHIVGFFRAFGTTLDCLAAVATGILRIPRSIQRASFRPLLGDPGGHEGWARFKARITRDSIDSGWLGWSLEFRHALMHRARQVSFLLPRPRRVIPVLVGPADPMEFARFEYFFSRRPWLPDLAHLARDGPFESNVLHEPAQETMTELLRELNSALDDVLLWLEAEWEAGPSVPSPAHAWVWDDERAITFDGFRATSAVPRDLAEIRVSPDAAARMTLAHRVREELARRRGTPPG